MNTETGEIRELTDEQLAILNGEKPNLWVPIQDKELERVLRKLSKKERKVVMARIKPVAAPQLADSLEKVLGFLDEVIAGDQVDATRNMWDSTKKDGPLAKRARELKESLGI